MPNHVKTIIKASGPKEDLLKVHEKYSSEDEYGCTIFPDFHKVIPHPPNIFTGNLDHEARELCRKENIPNWYDWQIENWGTKWNSYDHDFHSMDEEFSFDTAWSHPLPIILEMSKQNPEVTFEVMYADEDWGSNCAEYTAKAGEILSENVPESQSNEAYEVLFKVDPSAENYFQKVDGNWEYIDED